MSRRITLQEVSFIGTYTYTAQDFKDTAKAIFDGRLGPLDWIERRPLSEGNRAFSEIREGKYPLQKLYLAQMINKNRRKYVEYTASFSSRSRDNVGVVVVEGLTAGTEIVLLRNAR